MRKTKEQKQKTNKGITLIALIITIIVMLILVAVTITIAVNGGLFEYAGRAGKETNEAIKAEQELANLEYGLSTEDLIAKYTGGWVDNRDGTFSNKNSTVNLGDYINYVCWNAEIDEGDLTYTSPVAKSGWKTAQEFTLTESNSSSIKWRVIGVENGNLLIAMETPIYLNNEGYKLEGAEGYRNGITELNNICKIYGHGTNAVGARSITVEDVNKISGYNPLKAEENGTQPYGYGQVYQYKNGEVTYTKTESGITYEYGNNQSGTAGNSNMKLIELGATESNTILTVDESTYYTYAYDIVSDDLTKTLLFGECDEDGGWNPITYLLASSCVIAVEGSVEWGLFLVEDGCVSANSCWYSDDGARRCNGAVRPVVSLKSDIKLKPATAANTWDFDTTAE